MPKFVVIQTFLKTFEVDAPNASEALQQAEVDPRFKKGVTVTSMINWNVHKVQS